MLNAVRCAACAQVPADKVVAVQDGHVVVHGSTGLAIACSGDGGYAPKAAPRAGPVTMPDPREIHGWRGDWRGDRYVLFLLGVLLDRLGGSVSFSQAELEALGNARLTQEYAPDGRILFRLVKGPEGA